MNVARGGVIEDSALVYALDNKIVAVRINTRRPIPTPPSCPTTCKHPGPSEHDKR